MSSNRLMSRTTIRFSSNRQTSLENSWHMGSRIAELLSEKCVGRPIPSPIRQQRLEVTALFHVDTHNFAGVHFLRRQAQMDAHVYIMALRPNRLMEPGPSGCASGMEAKFFGTRIS